MSPQAEAALTGIVDRARAGEHALATALAEDSVRRWPREPDPFPVGFVPDP